MNASGESAVYLGNARVFGPSGWARAVEAVLQVLLSRLCRSAVADRRTQLRRIRSVERVFSGSQVRNVSGTDAICTTSPSLSA